jgi:predicted dehydrogenase
MADIRLMTLDPGHFHAALVQKEMHPGISPRTHVYAPLGPDLAAHVGRLAAFNTRPERPTDWELEVHAGPDSLKRLLSERPGNVLVLSGRNRGKIDAIVAAVEAGINVLADKPWIIDADDFPKLEAALSTAEDRGLVALDVMTERHEITSILQRELVNDPETFGTQQPGSLEEPGVLMESVHYLLKQVAGAPLRRPAWFFDVAQQGEGLTDVGTHLVDLVLWMLSPGQARDYRTDVQVHQGRRWPTHLSREDFRRITGEEDFSPLLAASVVGDELEYFCNTQVDYALGGVHVRLIVRWDREAEPGAGDTHFAVFRGSRSRVEVRQGKEQNHRPELYVVPREANDHEGVTAALRQRVERIQAVYPGVAVQNRGNELRVVIPDRYRVGHEAHFGEVMRQFLDFLEAPKTLPAWERPNMLAKYFITTQGVRLARAGGS